MLVVEPGAWVDGYGERRISNYIKAQRAIAAQETPSIAGEKRALEKFARLFGACEDRRHDHDSDGPRTHRSDPVSYLEHNAGDMGYFHSSRRDYPKRRGGDYATASSR